MGQNVLTAGERTVTTQQHPSEAQRWALMAAFNGSNTEWVHGNTLNSLIRLSGGSTTATRTRTGEAATSRRPPAAS